MSRPSKVARTIGLNSASTSARSIEPMDESPGSPASSSSDDEQKVAGPSIKTEAAAAAAAAPSGPQFLSSIDPTITKELELKFLACFQAQPNVPVDSSALVAALGTPADATRIINAYLKMKRLKLFQKGPKKGTAYQLISIQDADKFRDLSQAELLIYQLIEVAGNVGVWRGDLRKRSSLQPQPLDKAIKALIRRKLIKLENSIVTKNRKVYLLYDLQPALEITGRSWYVDGEFDEGLFDNLYRVVYGHLKQKGGTTPEQAAEFVSKTGAFQVNFTEDDARVVLNAMVYDGIAELAGGGGTLDTLASLLGPDANITEQPGSAASGAAAAASKKRKREALSAQYRPLKGAIKNSFVEVPCATCPVAQECHPNGVVNPQGCAYFSAWLDF